LNGNVKGMQLEIKPKLENENTCDRREQIFVMPKEQIVVIYSTT